MIIKYYLWQTLKISLILKNSKENFVKIWSGCAMMFWCFGKKIALIKIRKKILGKNDIGNR